MNVFLPVKQLQTFLICFILMTISVSTRAADSPLLIKNLGEGHCLVRQYFPELPASARRGCVSRCTYQHDR